jgi:hypothetical protein
MGVRSDVGLAVKKAAWEEAPESFRDFWISESDEVLEDDEGTLFVLKDYKWYTDYEDIRDVLSYLRSRPEDYLCVEACSEYPDADSEEGEWRDNPWNLTLNISVTLSYEA